MDQKDNMVKGLLIGFLAGSAIGAVLALLYAPKSGKEFRADIRQKTGDILEDAETYARTARERASEVMGDAKRRSDQLISDAQKKANTLINDADKLLSGARQKAGSVVEEGVKVTNAVKAGVEAFKDERKRS
jgi:gas vesicle protein